MSVQDKKNNHTVAFVTINNDSNKNDIEQAALAYDSFQGIPSTQASRTRYHDVETNISVRNGFTRDDYEYFRKDEQTPKRAKEIISSCMGAYRKIGLIRNVIDLMSDLLILILRYKDSTEVGSKKLMDLSFQKDS